MNWNQSNRKRGLFLTGAALGLMGFAGIPAGADDATQPAPAVDADYRLGVDDIISITSPGHEDITQDTTVLPDGFIHVSGLPDPIRAEGLTIREVRAKIFKGLDRLYNNLELSVKIKGRHLAVRHHHRRKIAGTLLVAQENAGLDPDGA